MAALYQDQSIQITENEIIIAKYYFPMMQAKVIPWKDVIGWSAKALTATNGRYRLWGLSLHGYWFNWDVRVKKHFMIVINTGQFTMTAITPDDFESVRKIFEAKLIIQK